MSLPALPWLLALFFHPLSAQTPPRAILADGPGPWRDAQWAFTVSEFSGLLTDAGYAVTTISPVDLPSTLGSSDVLLAIPSMESLPFDTFTAITAYVSAGGSIMASGGEPFRDPLYLTPGRMFLDPDWRAWVNDQYGSLANAQQAWAFTPPLDGSGQLTNPLDDQIANDGPWRIMVAAYRRFLEDYLGRNLGSIGGGHRDAALAGAADGDPPAGLSGERLITASSMRASWGGQSCQLGLAAPRTASGVRSLRRRSGHVTIMLHQVRANEVSERQRVCERSK